MEEEHSGKNFVELFVHELFGDVDWPNSVRHKFRMLQEKYPQCWNEVMKRAPDFFKPEEIEAVLHEDKKNSRLTVDALQLHEVKENFWAIVQKYPDIPTEEDSNAFGKELFDAVLSASIHLLNSPQANNDIGLFTASVLKDQVRLDEISHGPTEVLDRIDSLAAFTSSRGPIVTPPWAIGGISLTTEKFPYPINEQFNAKECVALLHRVFIETGRLDCSLDEFESHLLKGEVGRKLIWKNRVFEIAWFHKLLVGDFEGVKGINFLSKPNIHALAARHYVDEHGRELSPGSLSASLHKATFDPSKDLFVQAFAETIKKFA